MRQRSIMASRWMKQEQREVLPPGENPGGSFVTASRLSCRRGFGRHWKMPGSKTVHSDTSRKLELKLQPSVSVESVLSPILASDSQRNLRLILAAQGTEWSSLYWFGELLFSVFPKQIHLHHSWLTDLLLYTKKKYRKRPKSTVERGSIAVYCHLLDGKYKTTNAVSALFKTLSQSTVHPGTLPLNSWILFFLLNHFF